MSCFAIMRGQRQIIENAPIVDGQFFMETDTLLSTNDYNKIYIDNNNVRRELGINSWFGLSKPFESIDGVTLKVKSNALTMSQEWSQIENKPFETIGSTLFVENGVLKFGYQWTTIKNKPFYTVGYGLNVDENGNLNANIKSVSLSQIGTASRTTSSHQGFLIDSYDIELDIEVMGTRYMEYTQNLSTTNDTIFTFESFEINLYNMVEVYTSIWGVVPKAVNISNGTCTVTFAPVTSSIQSNYLIASDGRTSVNIPNFPNPLYLSVNNEYHDTYTGDSYYVESNTTDVYSLIYKSSSQQNRATLLYVSQNSFTIREGNSSHNSEQISIQEIPYYCYSISIWLPDIAEASTQPINDMSHASWGTPEILKYGISSFIFTSTITSGTDLTCRIYLLS